MQNKTTDFQEVESVLYQLLNKRYGTNSPELTSLFSNVLNEHDPVARGVKFLEDIASRIDFSEIQNPPQPEESNNKSLQGSDGEGDENGAKFLADALEDFANGRNAAPNFGTINEEYSLHSFQPLSVSPKHTEFYHSITGSFTDSWQQYLRRDDGRMLSLRSGKFYNKHAYKTELTPAVFYKDVNVIRESDLKVFLFIDTSGSTYGDMSGKRKDLDLSYYDTADISKVLKGKDSFEDSIYSNHKNQNISSSYYMTTLALAMGHVLKLGNCSLDFSYFHDHNINITDIAYVEKDLDKLFFANKTRGGGGTDLTESFKYLDFRIPNSKNRDKLILVLTDGAITNQETIQDKLSAYATDYNVRSLFVGIGSRMPKEFASIPKYDALVYEDANDLIARFAGDFSQFLLHKFFLEE